ncbi:MAG TPA: molybdenum ABC transporter ATP-binding protein [Steroidobacteraceae bacterium]|nr:molybdenum ABC transporter ATP-binding protein [Steroidobacteraceae bacterium]
MALELSVSLARGPLSLQVTCTLPTRGVTALFGRSGSGKTTLLRCIAGLERLPARVCFDGVLWQDARHFVPTHARGVGYVFQEASLFPHRDVRGNLAYALQRQPAGAGGMQLEEVVGLLGLTALMSQRVQELSGGERQRVAIARALLASPRLLLMDEPLSSLDEQSKAEILPHLTRLHETLAIPVIYVSHSIGEVMRLADHLALLQEGRVREVGAMAELLTRADLPLGIGEHRGAVLSGVIDSHEPRYHLSYVHVSGGLLAVSLLESAPGKAVRVRIDARDVSLTLRQPEQTSITNVLPAMLVDLTPEADPAQTLVRLRIGEQLLLARITRRSAEQLALAPGMALYAQIKSVALMDP